LSQSGDRAVLARWRCSAAVLEPDWAVIKSAVAPAIAAFKPDLIMVSSGCDPSAFDPLGRMSVTSDGFRGIAERLIQLAKETCGGKIVFSHEGGYSPVHVPFCGLAVLETLSGVRTDVVDPFDISVGSSTTKQLAPWHEEAIREPEALAWALGDSLPSSTPG
jgi:acetoin utilization deacetylase AcuC-like enzyme